ncbi:MULTISPECIES: lipid II-degrading bacteriocin [Burkholderia]|uniref:lipid II-degrading bacteriocin n=1 Tax=Burkholderia TaxID=32008 RepID=UPI0011AFD0CC|nr:MULTISPECIES: lipid II-degrading bacteriocin [unclassified Burkholderia]
MKNLNKFNRKRRALLSASAVLPATALLSLKSWSVEPDPTLKTIDVVGQRPANGLPYLGAPIQQPDGSFITPGRANIVTIGGFPINNGKKILEAVEQEKPLEALTQFAFALANADEMYVRSQASIYGLMTQWLANGGYVNQPGATPYGFLEGSAGGMHALFGVCGNEYHRTWITPPPSEFKFYGTPFMPIAALYYWLFGDGSARSMNLESLNLHLGVEDFSPVSNAIGNFGYGPGKYPIDAQFSTNTFNNPKDLMQALAFGRISGHIVGVLELTQDGRYLFDGKYELYSDRYKAYESNRPGYQEVLTKFLTKIGDAFGHRDYDVIFSGSKEIHFSGARSAVSRP